MTDEPGDDFPVPREPGDVLEPEKVRKKSGPKPGTPGAERAREAASRGGKAAQAARRAKADAKTPADVATSTEIERARNSLNKGLIKGSSLVFPIVPIPAGYVQRTSEEISNTLASIASRNPAWLGNMQKVENVMDYVAIGAWLGGLALATAVQFQRVSPDSPMLDGYPEIIEAIDVVYVRAEVSPDGGSDPDADRGTDPRPSGVRLPSPAFLGERLAGPQTAMAAG